MIVQSRSQKRCCVDLKPLSVDELRILMCWAGCVGGVDSERWEMAGPDLRAKYVKLM